MKVAVVGATGMVGEVMLKVLAERNFPVTELIPVASEKSIGKIISFKGNDYKVVGLSTAVSMRPDIALFSAGGDTSLEWAPKFAEVGTTDEYQEEGLIIFDDKTLETMAILARTVAYKNCGHVDVNGHPGMDDDQKQQSRSRIQLVHQSIPRLRTRMCLLLCPKHA